MESKLKHLIQALGGYHRVCIWLNNNVRRPTGTKLTQSNVVMWAQRDKIPDKWIPPMIRLCYSKSIHKKYDEWPDWHRKYMTTL